MNILITGTGSGLGSGLAKWYLENGHDVYGISRSSNPDLEKYPGFRFLSQDISKPDELEHTVPRFIKGVNELDLVILNAGILPEIKDMKDCSLAEIKKVMDVNVWANKILMDILFSGTGSVKQIAAISSGAAVSGNRGWNSYSLSKAALNMLVQLYSAERPGTHFSAVAPGLIDTGMQEYISSLPDDHRFPMIDVLKKARGTDKMPEPSVAAERLAKVFKEVRSRESGIFIDVREM